jgi:hypothetical protein
LTGRQAAQIFPRHLRNFLPFVPVDCCFGGLYIFAFPGLNFYETKYILVPTDQIDLSSAPGDRKFLATKT